MKRADGRPPVRHEPLSDDALETSKLVVELVHAALATGDVDAPGARGRADTSWRISPHAVRATIHVYQHGERTIGELASGLGVSLGWASRIVSELDQAGLVARTADPADRRIVRVSLTPEALDIVEDAYRWRGDAIERALAGLDADGRAAVRAFLRQAIDQLRIGHQARPSADRSRSATPRRSRPRHGPCDDARRS